MKYNFKEGKQRVIKMLEEHIFNFKADMSQDIKTIINEEREDAIEQVEDIIESIRMNTNYCEMAINKVKQSSTVVEILDAMESTAYEEMEETVLSELLGLESITREN
jgi:predicted DNA-binding antitoxin AbrB/MazE fold protein